MNSVSLKYDFTLHTYRKFSYRTGVHFLKASLRQHICNHKDLDEIAHIAIMAYNVFPLSSAGEAPFDLMFGYIVFILTLFKLLLLKWRDTGDKKCRIHLDAMWEIYMMAVLNLRIARDKCYPQSEIWTGQISK